MSTKTELEAEIKELKTRIAERDEQMPEVAVVTLAYAKNGALQAVAASHVTSAQELRAMKAALAQLTQQTDMLLYAAIEREAKEGVREAARPQA